VGAGGSDPAGWTVMAVRALPEAVFKAAVLGATRQTVKARLHRARLLIREHLTR
jgi:hypothetical protein